MGCKQSALDKAKQDCESTKETCYADKQNMEKRATDCESAKKIVESVKATLEQEKRNLEVEKKKCNEDMDALKKKELNVEVYKKQMDAMKEDFEEQLRKCQESRTFLKQTLYTVAGILGLNDTSTDDDWKTAGSELISLVNQTRHEIDVSHGLVIDQTEPTVGRISNNETLVNLLIA